MGHIHHSNARTTARVRQEIQGSKESIAALAARYGINHKTVLYWKHAGRVDDKKSGPTNPRSSVLTEAEEQIICEFRRVTKFSLDDVFVSLKDKIPALTRSNLHRCLQRNGLSRLPAEEGGTSKSPKKTFKSYDIGYVHIDITEIRLKDRKLYLFVGIDRVSKYAYVELVDHMRTENAVTFLKNFMADCPFKIHTILTDNGAQFTYALLAENLRPKNKTHPFDEVCGAEGIRHRLTKFKHPWTNGQVEAMNKTIKKNTTKKYHYESVEALKKHLMAFLLAYNFQRKLKALKYKSPYDTLIDIWKEKPDLFKINPLLKTVGLNTYHKLPLHY